MHVNVGTQILWLHLEKMCFCEFDTNHLKTYIAPLQPRQIVGSILYLAMNQSMSLFGNSLVKRDSNRCMSVARKAENL